jgi:hypothetical protein
MKYQLSSPACGRSHWLSCCSLPRRLAFSGRDNRPVVEPGDFDVMVEGLTTRLVVR